MTLYNANVDIMVICIQNFVKFCPFILNIWSKKQIITSIKGRNSFANLRKTIIYIRPTSNWSMIMSIQNLVSFCQFVLKILSKNKFLHEARVVTVLQICEKQLFTIPT